MGVSLSGSFVRRSLALLLLTHPVQALGDFRYVQGHFHQCQVFLVDLGVNLRLYLRLHDVIDGQVHGHAGEGASPAGVAVDDRLSVKLGAIRIGGAQDDHQVVFTVLVDDFLDTFLTLRVKRTGGGSDKALGLHQQRLGAGALHALGNSRALNAVPFADNDDLLPLQINRHAVLPFVRL